MSQLTPQKPGTDSLVEEAATRRRAVSAADNPHGALEAVRCTPVLPNPRHNPHTPVEVYV